MKSSPYVLPMRCLICEAEWEASFDLPSTGEAVSIALNQPCPECKNDDLAKIVIVDQESSE